MDQLFAMDQSRVDWERARRKALWAAVVDALSKRPGELVPLHEVKRRLKIRGSHYRGLQHVPLNRIIGSEGRYADFDRRFLPRRANTARRWISIDTAQHNNIHLPPVELYQIGNVYFVKDGHHRISVARQHGQADIDAFVTEYEVDVPLEASFSMRDLLLKQEYSEFLNWTDLARLRPQHGTELSELGGYPNLLEHINTHRYYLALERGAPVSLEDAVVSWCDNVYLPVVEVIRENELLRSFPGRTEADLYLWIMQHRAVMAESAGTDPGPETATLDYARRFRPRSLLGTVTEAMQGLAGATRAIAGAEESSQAGPPTLLEWSQIALLCPEAEIKVTNPADLARLRKHIEDHQYYLGTQWNRSINCDDAARDWCTNYYLPVVRAIRERALLVDWPGRSETELYLEVMDQLYLLKEASIEAKLSDAVTSLQKHRGLPRTPRMNVFTRFARRLACW